MLVPLESSSAVLVMISSKYVSICNRFHARWANSGKITISKAGTPLWCPRSRGISSPSGTKLPRKKLDILGYHMVQTRSLYLTWHWICTGSWETDGQTDRNPIASTRLRLAVLAVARKNDTRVNKNCKYNASNKKGNSNTKVVSLFWPTLHFIMFVDFYLLYIFVNLFSLFFHHTSVNKDYETQWIIITITLHHIHAYSYKFLKQSPLATPRVAIKSRSNIINLRSQCDISAARARKHFVVIISNMS